MPAPFDTPKKARVKGAILLAQDLQENDGIKISRERLARLFNCNPHTISRLKYDTMDRTKPSEFGETRGRKRKLNSSHIAAIEKMYDEYPEEAPDMPWTVQLQHACDLDASSETIRKAMNKVGVFKRVACVRPYVPPDRAEERVRFCREKLEMWDQADFLRNRYSDESHFGWK